MGYYGPRRFAHKGYQHVAPENTLEAFKGAAALGVEGIELDVNLSKDGEIIVTHDSDMTRITIGHPTHASIARIRELPWKEVCAIEMPYANHLFDDELPPHSDDEFMASMPRRFLGTESGSDYTTALAKDPRMGHLSRFLEVDEWLAESNADLEIEIEVKVPGTMPRFEEILKNSKNVDRYFLFSGSKAIVEEMTSYFDEHDSMPRVRRGANIRFLTDEAKEWAVEQKLYEVGLNADAFGEDEMKWCKDKDIKVFANLGDYYAWYEKLVALNPYGFKTNYPVAYTKWWEGHKK